MAGTPSGGTGGRLVIQTKLDPARYYILIPVQVGDSLLVDFVLDTGAPLTSMSRRLYVRLRSSGCLADAAAKNRYILSSASIAGVDVSPLHIRGSIFLGRVGVEGVLGLDFLARYTDIHFSMKTGILTLMP